jgi:peptidyl-prolyl cis-trans isomerase B (cyclophilin B)
MARTRPAFGPRRSFSSITRTTTFLDKTPGHDGWGYAVFGKVTQGMDIVDKIAKVPTGNSGMHQNVPTDAGHHPVRQDLSDK